MKELDNYKPYRYNVKPFSTVSLPMPREDPGQSYPYPIPSGSE